MKILGSSKKHGIVRNVSNGTYREEDDIALIEAEKERFNLAERLRERKETKKIMLEQEEHEAWVDHK